MKADDGGHFISRAIQFMQIEMYAGQKPRGRTVEAEPLDEAEAEYLRAIEVDPENAGLLYHVAHELSARKKYAEAEVAFRAAVRLDPNNSDYREQLRKVRQKLGVS